MKLSFHCGLNLVDHRRYDGWQGLLKNPRSDAAVESEAARLAGFTASCAFDSDVTRDAVSAALKQAQRLQPEDTFLFTFSGHGAPDQAICLYDDLLLDTEFHNAIAALKCQAVVVLDSCFSGGMDREYDPRLRTRAMPGVIADMLRTTPWPPIEPEDYQGNAIFLTACTDAEFALDGYGRNGAFTECRMAAFQAALNAKQNFTWRQWLAAAAGRCALDYPTQHPQIKFHGPNPYALADSNVIA